MAEGRPPYMNSIWPLVMKHDSQKKKERVAFLGRRKENLKGEKKQTDDMEFSHNKTWMMTYRYLAFFR